MPMSNMQALQCAIAPGAIEALITEARRQSDVAFCVMAVHNRNTRNVLYILVALEIIFIIGAIVSAKQRALKAEYACIALSLCFGLITTFVAKILYNTTTSLQYLVNHQIGELVVEDRSVWRELEI